MRQLIKLSFITLAVVAFVWTAGSLHAMPVAGPPPGERDQIALDIGGFAGVITSYILTPHEQGGEVPPATFTTTTELRLNVTVGTDTISVTQARWIRESNDEINFGFAEAPYQFGQFTWRPTDFNADSTCSGSMIWPHGASTVVTSAPQRWAMSTMRVPKKPLWQTMTVSPGSTTL